jgi:hypothetical protein
MGRPMVAQGEQARALGNPIPIERSPNGAALGSNKGVSQSQSQYSVARNCVLLQKTQGSLPSLA